MKIDLGAAATAAWALFRRDRDVLFALAGMFLFLPTLATLLLVGPAPQRPAADAGKAAIDAWTTHYADWLSANLPGIGAAALLAMLGGLSITAFYADRARPDVGSALAIALRRLPAFFAQSLMLSLPASIGFLGLLSPALFVLLLPGLWFSGARNHRRCGAGGGRGRADHGHPPVIRVDARQWADARRAGGDRGVRGRIARRAVHRAGRCDAQRRRR